MEGIIRSLNRKKGQVGGKPTFGFILADTGEELFFVPSSLELSTISFDELEPGMEVEFTPINAERMDKGRRAIEIRVTGRRQPKATGGVAATPGGRQ